MEQPATSNTKKEKLKVIEWLAEQFPAAFFTKGKDIRPLQIGILDDIIDFYERLEAPLFSKKQLREALNYYSGSPSYLKSQLKGKARVDLYGNEVDIVNESQEQYAKKRFEDRYGQNLRHANK